MSKEVGAGGRLDIFLDSGTRLLIKWFLIKNVKSLCNASVQINLHPHTIHAQACSWSKMLLT